MKFATSLNSCLMTLLVFGLMLFTSCAKEPLVAPANVDTMTKSCTLSDPRGGDAGHDQLLPGTPDRGKEDGISDDGDDLSDKENSNKKKVN